LSAAPSARAPDAAPARQVPPDTVIAIDGPAGSGKSTTARALADALDLLYVDSGAMYRALTWAAAERGVPDDDGAGLAALLASADLRLETPRGETRVTWNGRDISAAIRTPEVEARVSAVSAHPGVRRAMVERQRALGRERGVVMEGRDIGSVVFPLASAKIYLDATPEARADRRLRQYQRRGVAIDRADVLRELAVRDRRDSQRAESPLVLSPDAVLVDNSDMTLQEQLEVTTEAVLRVLDDKRPAPSLQTASRPTMPLKYRVAYRVFVALGRFFGLKVHGREFTRDLRGYIVAPNHISNWDPPLMAAGLDDVYPLRAVAKEELFRHWPTRLIYRFLDAVPIKRSIYDAAAFDQAAAFLEQGANILFYPEGTRRVFGQPGPVRNGLGMIMQRTGAPALPIMTRGTLAPLPGGSPRAPLEIRIAPPVRLYALRPLLARMSEKDVNRAVARLFERIYGELLARSFAVHPCTDWELEAARRMAPIIRRKEKRVFGRVPPAPRP
jgi:cytidylate kinase